MRSPASSAERAFANGWEWTRWNKDNPLVLDLELIYAETLRRCAPDVLVRQFVTPDLPRNIVAIGKCAASLLDGFAAAVPIESAFAAVPAGYPLPRTPAVVMQGGHPQMDSSSFRAGEELVRFVEAHEDITFLISGGGSACVEVPLTPLSEDHLIRENARLIASGLPIADINAARKQSSAIKGGRLAERVRGRHVTLVYSDVASGDLASVASGPSISRDSIAILIADNETLTSTAASLVREHKHHPVQWAGQLESAVDTAARDLARRAAALDRNEVLIAGGEPTVVVHGAGRGGRCSEMAVRFALATNEQHLTALFASSDGVDGSSGAAGFRLDFPVPLDRSRAEAALAASDSAGTASQIGRPIIIPPTGNNLRDLYLVARS
jgi:glycerate 2-kinase